MFCVWAIGLRCGCCDVDWFLTRLVCCLCVCEFWWLGIFVGFRFGLFCYDVAGVC